MHRHTPFKTLRIHLFYSMHTHKITSDHIVRELLIRSSEPATRPQYRWFNYIQNINTVCSPWQLCCAVFVTENGFCLWKKKLKKGHSELKDTCTKTLHGIMSPLLDIRWRNGGVCELLNSLPIFIKLPNKYTCVGTYVYFFAKAQTVFHQYGLNINNNSRSHSRHRHLGRLCS